MFFLFEHGRQVLHQPRGRFSGRFAENTLDGRTRRGQRRLVHKPLALGPRLVRPDVGLGGRADIELQLPGAFRVDLAARELQEADLRQVRVQVNFRRLRLFLPPRVQHRSDGGQGGELRRVYPDHLAGWVHEPRAGDIDRELDRLGERELQPHVADLVVLPRDGATRREANRPRLRARDADVIAPRKRRRNAHALAPSHHAVVGRPVVPPPGRDARRRAPAVSTLLPPGGENQPLTTSSIRSRSTADSKNPPFRSTTSGRAGS